MKNLKKILALVMAFAVAFTVMAGATFTDQSDIQATEAVNMLTALDVINGNPDGSFNPDGTVTRAEMAKMIYVVMSGGNTDASAYENMPTTFQDINGHWAAGYIKFAQSNGIIAGKSAIQFDPDGLVTGTEAAKMLLVVMGYDATKAGLVGTGWDSKTIGYATRESLLDDVNANMTAGLPRQYAAQIIYNTLDAYRVKWSTDSNSFDYFIGTNNAKETVGRKYMSLCTDVGNLTDLSNDSLTIKIDDAYSSDNYHSSDTVGFTKVKEDYSSLLGQKVKVMFKDGKTNNVIGIYAVSDNAVYSTLMNKTELDGDKIKFDGTSYSVESNKKIATTFIGIDGTTTEDKALSYFDDTDANKVSLNEVTFIDSDGNGKIDSAIVIEKTAGEITSVSSSKVTFKGKSYNFSDETIDDSLAQDDWAVMSKNLYNDNKNIVKADVLTTTVASYKYKDSAYSQYKLDDTWYNVATDVKDDAGVSTGDSVKAYVANGIIVKMKSDDGKGGFPTNVAIVVGTGGSGTVSGDQARIRMFDGTSKVVTLSDNSTLSVSVLEQGKAYKISGSDTSMKFENVVATQKYNSYEYIGTSAAPLPDSDSIGGTKVDDTAAVILYTEAGTSKQITGKQFKALANTDMSDTSNGAMAYFTKDVNGLTRVMMASVLVGTTNVTGKSSDNYAYITTDATENSDGNTTYTIWTTDNEYVDVTEETTYSSGDRMKGMLIGYSTIDSDGTINDVDVAGDITDGTAIVDGHSFADGTLYYGGNASESLKTVAVDDVQFNVTADTKVLFVDSDADSDQIGQDYTYNSTSMRKAQKYADGTYTRNVLIIPDESGTDDLDIKALVLDTTGAFKGYKVDEADETADNTGDYNTTAAAVNVSDTSIVTAAASSLNASGDLTVQVTVPAYVAEATTTASIKVDGVTVGIKKADGMSDYDNKLTAGTNTLKVVDEDISSSAKVVVTLDDLAVTKATVDAIVNNAPTDKFTSVAYKTGENLANGMLAVAGEAANITVTPKSGVGTSKTITVKVKLTNATVGGETELTLTGTTDGATDTNPVNIALGTVKATGTGAVGVEILSTSTIAA